MPIITQAYPCMNSSYNVSSSTLRIMTEEFQRGMKFVRLWTQTRLVGIIYLSHILSSNHIRIICRLISVQQMMTTLGSGNMLIYMNFGFLFFLLGRIQQLSVITCNIISTCFIDMMIDYSTENAPLQRELSAEEVGSTAAFLASPLASAITGDVVYVDNGLNAMGVGVDSPVFKDLDHQSFSYQFCESKNFDYIKNKCMPSHLFYIIRE